MDSDSNDIRQYPQNQRMAQAAMLSCAAFGDCNYMHGMIFTFRLHIGANLIVISKMTICY